MLLSCSITQTTRLSGARNYSFGLDTADERWCRRCRGRIRYPTSPTITEVDYLPERLIIVGGNVAFEDLM